MNVPRRAGALVAMLFCAGCATVPPYNPFQVEKAQIFERVKKVVVMPMDLDQGTLNVTNALRAFEQRTEEHLEELGFKVVGAERVRPITEKMKTQMGGLFDPKTGKMDEEKAKRIKDLIQKEMITQFKVDALVSPVVFSHTAPFANNSVKWNGRQQSLSRSSGLGKVFEAKMQGSVGVISFVIVIRSATGEDLFINGGGIQALHYLVGGQFVNIPPDEILADDKINEEAVTLAFKPLEEDESAKEKK